MARRALRKNWEFLFPVCGRQVALSLQVVDEGLVQAGASVALQDGEALPREALDLTILDADGDPFNCVWRPDWPLYPEIGAWSTRLASYVADFRPIHRDVTPAAVQGTLWGEPFELRLDDTYYVAKKPPRLPAYFPWEALGEKAKRSTKGSRKRRKAAGEKCCVRHFFVNTYRDNACLHQRWDRLTPAGRQIFARVVGFARFYAQFEETGSCACHCCEFRQYIRGGFWIEGRPVPFPLAGGLLNPNIYQEDAVAGERVGHRADPQRSNDLYMSPDRAKGCFYVGSDDPGIQGTIAGVRYKIDLEFVSMILDVCRQLVELGNAKDWAVKCEGTT